MTEQHALDAVRPSDEVVWRGFSTGFPRLCRATIRDIYSSNTRLICWKIPCPPLTSNTISKQLED